MPSRDDYARLAMLLAGHMDDLQRLASNLARDVAALMSAKDVEVAVLAEMMVRDFGPPAATAQNSRKLKRVRSLVDSMRSEGRQEAVAHLKKELDALARNEEKFNRAWLLALFAFMGQPKPRLRKLAESDIDAVRRHGLFGNAAIDEIFGKVAAADTKRIYAVVHRRIYGQIDDRQMLDELPRALSRTAYQAVVNAAMVVNGASNDIAAAVAKKQHDAVAEKGGRGDSFGLMWITEMDERVCADCDVLEGVVFAAGEAPGCPLHPNCRCHLIPVSSAFANDVKALVEESKK